MIVYQLNEIIACKNIYRVPSRRFVATAIIMGKGHCHDSPDVWNDVSNAPIIPSRMA